MMGDQWMLSTEIFIKFDKVPQQILLLKYGNMDEECKMGDYVLGRTTKGITFSDNIALKI